MKIQQSFNASLWVASVHGIDRSIDFTNDYPILPDGSVGNNTISETILSRDEHLFTFNEWPVFTPFTKIQRGPNNVWYFLGDIFWVPMMRTYLLTFRDYLLSSYPGKCFDDMEIELSDPTDDDISVSKNSYQFNPHPQSSSNVLVASLRKKDSGQAFQSTLAANVPESARKASQPACKPTSHTANTGNYGSQLTLNPQQITDKVQLITATKWMNQ